MRKGEEGSGAWSVACRAGRFRIVFQDGGLRSLRWEGRRRPEAAPAAAKRLGRDIDRFLSGNPLRHRYRLLLRGTPFQERVWKALRRIPRGKVLTYAQMARRVGSPGAARAVGQACKANPIAILVPCHRVVAAGELGGYAGRWNARRKAALLRLEGAAW